MPASQGYIDGLIANPRESLVTELKDWIDPRSARGRAKIVRTCLATRNQNGGYLQVGFEDSTGSPNTRDAPRDVRAAWDADDIQGLISRFASVPFEVHLRFAKRDGQEFPVLEVEPGVSSPVASKSEIADPDNASKKLVKVGAVYVRSLSSSGVVSTTEAKYGDWPDLTRRCFDNLEADVGRFARRHLSGLTPETACALVGALGNLGGLAGSTALAGPSGSPPEVRVLELMRHGYSRFQEQQRRRDLTRMPHHGYWQVAVVVEGDVPESPATRDFLNVISAANPKYTGWPLWVDSRGFAGGTADPNLDQRPYTQGRSWEAFLYQYEQDSPYNYLDFWRAEPAGKFYLYRGFEDDITEGGRYPDAMTALDPGLVIWRTTEAIAVSLAFARAMGLTPEETILRYLFSWTGLRERRLSVWTDPKRFGPLGTGSVCHEHEVESPMISVPLDAPNSAIASFVRTATADLFAAFEGFEPGPGVTESLAEQLLGRGS